VPLEPSSPELAALVSRGHDVHAGLETCRRLAKEWSVDLIELLPEANHCIVVAGIDTQGREVVLRVPLCEEESGPGFYAQIAFAGRGGVEIYQWEVATGATLMARLRPGTMLLDGALSPNGEVEVCRSVIRRLDQPALAQAIEVERWYADFLRQNHAEEIPDELLRAAQRDAAKLLETTTQRRLLHGDLHHYNLLLHSGRWFAIDPKGVNGDPALEPAAFMRNPTAAILSSDDPTALMRVRLRGFADGLGISAERIWRWAVAHNVLSASWDEPAERAPTIRIVEAIIQAKP